MGSEDRLGFIPRVGGNGDTIALDERDFLIEFVCQSNLDGKAAVSEACLTLLDRYRDRRGLLAHVPRHWANSLPMDPPLFLRMMSRVEREAKSKQVAYQIIEEEVERWREAHPEEAKNLVPNEDIVAEALKYGIVVDEFWFR